MTLHEFNAQQSVQAASESLIIENKKSKHNVLIKNFNTAMQKCFSPDADHAELIKELQESLVKIESKDSGIKNPCTSTIFLTNFLAGLHQQIGDLAKANEYATRTLKDID